MKPPVLAIVALVISLASPALGEPMSARPIHWSVGAGGYAAITGCERTGSLLDAELFPGGRFGQLGFRIEGRGVGRALPSAVLAGVTLEAAAARPRLVLALYATVGANFDRAPMVAAGVQSQLFLIGPIALGFDGGGLLIIDGTANTELILSGALTVRLGH